MTKKHLTSIALLSTILALNCSVHANTVIKRTTSDSIYQSSTQKNDIVINVPYATKINKITVNTGSVTYSRLDTSTGKLYITVDKGSATSKWNAKQSSKYVTDTDTASTKSGLSSYISVSTSDGYSGSIPLDRTVETSTSKKVTGSAAIVQDWYYNCTGTGSLSANPGFNSAKADSVSNPKYIYSGGSWSGPHLNSVFSKAVPTNWTMSMTSSPSISNIKYSDNDGYSGTGTASLDNTVTSSINYDKYLPTPGNGWTLPKINQHVPHKNVRYNYTVSATVYKTMYKGYYEGYIYKGGYDSVYSYNITVDYDEDVLDLNLSLSNTSWTNQPINILATSNSSFFNYFTESVRYGYMTPSSFSVSSNGSYTVSVTDTGHGRTIRKTTKNITVSNIDKTLPSGTFSPSSRNTWDGDLTVSFTPSDSGGSGVKEWRYCTSSDNGVTYSAYSGYYTTNQNISLNKDGKNKIKVEIKDVAGNVNVIESGVYLIDKNPPVITLSPNGCAWRNTKITGTWSATDTGSLVKGYSYRITTINNSVRNTTNWSPLSLSTTKTDITAEGFNHLEVQAIDNAGNVAIYSSLSFGIDYTAPTLDIDVDSFISDKYVDIPIKLHNISDNLSGVSNIEVSLFEDFSQKVEITNVNTDYYLVELPRYGLSLKQTIYIKVTDNANNEKLYTKEVYLDPLPPEVPNVTGVEKDNLIINNEKVKIKWDYSDPGNFKLVKTVLTFTDKETNKTYTHTIEGDSLETTIEPAVPIGLYNLVVEVYNSENKSTKSTEEIQVRKNRFITKGNLYTEEITAPGNNIKYVKVNLDYSRQNLSENGKKYLADSKIYIILPELDGTFNLKNPTVKLEYKENTKNEALKLPGGAVDKLIVAIENTSTDTIYSRITPWLDSISVSVR